MNKKIVVMAAVATLTAAGFVYACGPDCEMNKMKDMKDGKPDMMHEMMMKHGMMKEDVIATSDGGVVILRGNHLIKYDRNLRLVNQADLPEADMKKMGKDCPMMKKMHESNKGVVNSKESDEHAAHH